MAGQGDGDDDTLAHTAGVLQRILVETSRGVADAHPLHDLDGLLLGLRLGDALMLFDDLGDLGADGPDGVQRGHGVLEDRGDLGAPDTFPILIGLQLGQILAMEHNGAVGDGAVGLQHAGEGLGEHRFSGAGLAHDGEGLALIEVQRHVPDGGQVVVPDPEFHFDVLGGQDDVAILFHVRPPLTCASADPRRRPASVPRCTG